MTARVGECARVFDRLSDGLDAASDPAVAAHLRSCLDCFRVLAELRDAPRIAELLRRDQASVTADLGSEFWEALTARTVEAAARTLPVAGAARPRRPAWSTRALGAARRPAGAALLGAAAAAALIFALGRRPSPPHAARSAVARSGLGEIATGGGDEDVADESAPPVDVAALDASELRRLLDGLRVSEPDELRAMMEAGAGEEGGVADDIAGLDGPALRRLARQLAGSAL